MAAPGRTAGNPNSDIGVKWYYKPSMGRLIGRIPGVVRKSAAVLAVNAVLEGHRGAESPAAKCHGLPWKRFVSCLRKEMKELMDRTKAEREANKRAIAERYNIPESTRVEPVWKRYGIPPAGGATE